MMKNEYVSRIRIIGCMSSIIKRRSKLGIVLRIMTVISWYSGLLVKPPT